MRVQRCTLVRLAGSPPLLAAIETALDALADLEAPAPGAERIGERNPALMLFSASAQVVPALLEQVASMRRDRPGVALVVAADELRAEHMTALLRAGVHDFVIAPFHPGELATRLRRALGLVQVDAIANAAAEMSPRLAGFVGRNAAFARQVSRLPAMAGCDAGVLILGETGTGKEVCAQAIHYLSPRASRPWIAVNCGAIPCELIESELFGHVRGAYTTALAAREGLVAEAEGGSLFLDDIDCLPMSAQSKLLRFLQEREYRPVGANAVRHADVRVIAASNCDLASMVARGRFRQDLYFRLNVLAMRLPPLRERRDDIPLLAAHFVQQFAYKHKRAPSVLSSQALAKLVVHDWPGNVRELQHVIERAMLLHPSPVLGASAIEIGDAPEPIESSESFRSAKARVVEQFERNYIENLLASCDGNVTHAANEAKKNRRAFFALIRKHRIEPERFRSTK